MRGLHDRIRPCLQHKVLRKTARCSGQLNESKMIRCEHVTVGGEQDDMQRCYKWSLKHNYRRKALDGCAAN